MSNKLVLQKIIVNWAEFAKSQNLEAKKRNKTMLLRKDFAAALVGVRRSGKTTIAIQAISSRTENFLYINFEDPYFSEFFESSILEDLIEEYFNLYNKKPEYIIFDEIHNIKNWERWARKFIDQKSAFLILTGSSAKMLSTELSTSLTGRNLTSEVWPLTFSEYLLFIKVKKENYKAEFNNFMKWGGFPRIVLEEDEKLRLEILRQYYSDATLKNVVKRNEIRDVRALLAVFNYYLANISSLHSYNSIKKAFNLSTHIPITYAQALTEAFLMFEVSLYSKNLKVQTRNPKKIYAIDTGFRNANAMSGNEDRGKLLENTVFLELKKRGKQLYYHKDKFECDFVVTENYTPTELIQVTESMKEQKTKERELAGLRDAMSQFKLSKGLIITLNEEGILKFPEGTIKVVSAWKYFLLEKLES
ncbi:MAG TPA: ATP-binding protein [Pseudobdellovibrionaceae bacterium]|nr:ATP-binding protein [Pseudobdellovibrionaceae bacterium]